MTALGDKHAKVLEDALNYARPRYTVSQRIAATGEYEIRVALTGGHVLKEPTLDGTGFRFVMASGADETHYIIDHVPMALDGVALAHRVLRLAAELNEGVK